jgi:hypothetical protein
MDRVIFMHEKAENVLIVLYTRIFAGLSVRRFLLVKVGCGFASSTLGYGAPLLLEVDQGTPAFPTSRVNSLMIAINS